MVEPRKLALRYTTSDPTHMITKIDVMMALESDSVRKDSVAESSRQRASGPQRSPQSHHEYSCAAPSSHSPAATAASRISASCRCY
jgi:hypothetical protein